MSDLKTVLRDLGGVFIIVGCVSLVMIAVPLFTEDTFSYIIPVILTSAVFFGVGLPLYYSLRNADPANFKTAMVTAALSWLLISVIGSIPFLLIPYEGVERMNFLSAFFESMSGWTGTGLTMINDEGALPMTLQFWRTLIQWIGGVGVIVLTLSILARPGTGSFVLYKGEARDQKTHPSIISTVRTIWWIFLLYTVIGIIALIIVGQLENTLLGQTGMTPWQSLNHAMTGLATGGFSVTDDSITSFGILSKITVVLLMILGAIAFAAHYNLLKGRIKRFFSDTQLKAMLVLFALGIATLTMFNLKFYQEDMFLSFQESSFQFISALTCTGFASITNLDMWSESAKLLLAFAMIIGGAAGSTAGGIKLFRAVLLYKGVGWRIKQALSTPRRVFVHKLGEKSLSKEDALDLINEAAIISFMWVILLAVGFFVISTIYPERTLGDVIFEVASAQGNVGLSTGITAMTMSPYAKIMLIVNMWIGRLEIIPIIVLFKSLLGKRRNLL
jgi:trk system potassium uptake protein TrkH